VKPSKTKFGDSSANEPASGSQVELTNFRPHESLTGLTGFAKRALDIVVAGSALIILSPVLAVIAIAIRLSDRGPALYRQVRVGLQQRTFTLIKFRTMYENAEAGLGPIWSVPRDPRCTRIGYYLRRSGFDELPQLWNVLRGEMSLVGPRPERPEFTREFRTEHRNYDLRHVARPGITGYAQIHGWRGYTSLEERLRHDIYYVRNWSIALDAYILAMTLTRGWSEKTRSGA
jgi:putative colanic acid biosynthesis UDP-glucose lipid carrier transferase